MSLAPHILQSIIPPPISRVGYRQGLGLYFHILFSAHTAAEKTGRRAFKIWAKLIKFVGKPGSSARKPILRVFMVYLIIAIILAFPLNYLIHLLQRIFNKKGLQRKVEYYSKNLS